MAQRSLKFCGRWTLRVNSLWLWCYCALVLAAEGYLMYSAVKRCRDYNELSWHSDEKPVSELYAYICLIVLSVMCMPFFIISSIFKVGCYSNDGTRLGRDNVLHHLNVETPDSTSARRGRFLRDVWRHAGPVSHTCHVLAAFALLLPVTLIEAQQVKFGFIKPEKMWSSELGVLYDETNYELKSRASDVIANTTDAPYSSRTTPSVIESGPAVISAEYVNYILALLIYSIRYAAVYWYTNAAFSIAFSAALLLTTLQHAYAYCGLQILYKFAVNEHALTGISLLLSHGAALSLHLLACTVTLLSPTALFNYGYCQYVAACRRFLQQHFPTYARYVAKMPVGCHGYVPHVIATSALVLFVAFRAPIVYDYVNVYRDTGFPILLTCIVVDACYMVLWIALWFALTLKQTWLFRINPQMDMLHSLQRAATLTAAAANNTTPPPETDVTDAQTDGDTNNNSRDGSAYVTQQPRNNVQVVDRPPPYSNRENVQTAQNHIRDEIKPQEKARKQLPPLHIETSEVRMNRSDQSPNRHNSPTRKHSPNRRNSPIRQNVPNSQTSPQRQHSPQRGQQQHSPRINNLSPRQESPNRHAHYSPHTSPHRQQSPNRAGDIPPPRQHSPDRRTSPERSGNSRQQSPARQLSYPSTTDTNPPDTPVTADTPSTPISPASALKKSGLRKSGERRHNVHQRVTFDDSVDHLGGSNPKLHDSIQLSPNSLRQRKKPKFNGSSIKKGPGQPQTIDVLTASGVPSAYTGSTPDNTLTRNYRSSIRDKCGEYYKHIGDLAIPPAAQSSPIPQSQPRPLSDNFDNRELVLSPLVMADALVPPPGHQRDASEIELTGYYEMGRSRDQQRRIGGRKSFEDDRHYSFPPQIPQSNRPPPPVYNNNNAHHNTHQYNGINSHVESRQYSPPRSNQSRTIPPRDPHVTSSRDLSIPSRDRDKQIRDISHEIARDLNKQFLPIMKARSYLNTPPTKPASSHKPELNREIKIVKPELNRRDSALPSSNETSSNDSAENVLCSQV